MAQPELVISVYGLAAAAFQDEVEQVVRECYHRLSLPLPATVTLWVCDTSATQQSLLARERRELGAVVQVGETLPVTHEAWSGLPRIMVCAEKLVPLPDLVRQAMLRVAVAHTVLHGSSEYYVLHIPAPVVQRGREAGMSSTAIQQLAYLAATAVKGHAVARLLANHGYLADQVALALHQLEVSPDDLLAWRLAQGNPQARTLYLAAQLRPLLFAQPLIPHAPALLAARQGLVAHLPRQTQDSLNSVVKRIGAAMSGDTHKDIGMALSIALEGLT